METSIKQKKDALEDFIKRLEAKPDYVGKEGFEKSIKMMKTSVESAVKVLDFRVKKEEVDQEIIELACKDASDAMEEIIATEK